MKRILSFLIAIMLLLGTLSGCGQQTSASGGLDAVSASTTESWFTEPNEIITYEKLDPEKTTLVVSKTGNIVMEPFCEEFEARNPDVQLVLLDLTGGNEQNKPVSDWVTHGYLPDVMLTTDGFMSNNNTGQYFENLSADPIIENYDTSALQRVADNANIY